jgi:hypothetical protein
MSSLAKDVESPGHGTVAPPRSDWRSWLIPVATVFGFAIPAVVYLWMIHTYGVNVIYWDQLENDVTLIGHAYSGTLHLSTLWSQHYENRIFFPNLIVLALAYTTHFNVLTEEYLSALLLFGATALVIGAHKRRSPDRRWIWYCPVAFLLLSLAQASNALWGFQMAWYLVLLMVALALFLLDQEPQRWPVFVGAIAAAVVASFSSLQGLLVWPAGLLLIYLRRRTGHLAIVWTGSAVLAGVIYFVGFNFNASHVNGFNLTAVFTFFVRVVGDILGESQPSVLVTVFGSVLVVTAIWVLLRFGIDRRTSTGGRPFALSLILFGLLFSVMTASGRSGYYALGVSVEFRYTVFAIFVLVGLYLVVLDPPLASDPRSSEHGARSRAQSIGRQGQIISDPLFTLARVVVVAGIVLTVIIGSVNGISQARGLRGHGLFVGEVTVRANQYPGSVLATVNFVETAQTIRRQIMIVKDHRLSLFGTGDAARYLNEKPLQLAPLRAAVLLPRNGSTLHGKQALDVLGSDSYDVTKVEFFGSGPELAETTSLATGASTRYGWIAIWNTSTVPNGSYTIDATVDDSGDRSVRTPPVEVRVENVNRPGS